MTKTTFTIAAKINTDLWWQGLLRWGEITATLSIVQLLASLPNVSPAYQLDAAKKDAVSSLQILLPSTNCMSLHILQLPVVTLIAGLSIVCHMSFPGAVTCCYSWALCLDIGAKIPLLLLEWKTSDSNSLIFSRQTFIGFLLCHMWTPQTLLILLISLYFTWSSDQGLLAVPWSRFKTRRKYSFEIVAPKLWNSHCSQI